MKNIIKLTLLFILFIGCNGVTKKSLYEGIREFKVGNRVGDISHAIQNYNEKKSPDNYHEIYEILNVPTFIFYRKEKEINRIVEITIETLEKDIFSILSDSGYENAYYGF